MIYEVKSRIWHSSEARYREVGETVNLDHLKPEWIDILVQADIVAPAQDSEVKETHGTDDSGDQL